MTMVNSTERPLCAECGDEVDPGEAHWLHEDGCPVQALAHVEHVPGAVEVREALASCSCDRVCHPDCCPQPDCVGTGS